MRAIASSDFRKRREADVWHSVNRFLGLCIAAGLVALAVLAFAPEMKRLAELGATLDETRRRLKAEEFLGRKLEREMHLLRNDPEYLESLARDKLGLMKEGETVFRLDTGETREIPGAPPPAPR